MTPNRSFLSRLSLRGGWPRAGAAAAVLLCAGAAASLARAAPEPVARVGATDVGAEELRAYVETLSAEERALLQKEPARLTQLVRAYLARRAVLQKALSEKLDQKPEVKAQLARVREEALVELQLQSVSRPPDGYPGGAEVEAAYQANLAAFAVPRQFRVAQVFVAAASGDREAEEKGRRKLEDLQRSLEARGADFAALARAESDDASTKAKGGEIGWLTEAEMVPGIRAAVAGLARDAVSEPLRLEDGWHIVKVLDTRPASTRPLAEVREALAARLRAERARAARTAYLSKLVEQDPPVINELALSKVMAGPAK